MERKENAKRMQRLRAEWTKTKVIGNGPGRIEGAPKMKAKLEAKPEAKMKAKIRPEIRPETKPEKAEKKAPKAKKVVEKDD